MVLGRINIILELALKDIRLRYNNLSFGYLWMMLNPILILITLYIVFSFVIKLDFPHYQMFLILGIIVWNFFSEATSNSIRSLVASMDLLKKIKIYPYEIILASNLSSTIIFIANLSVLLVMMLIFNINLFTYIRLMSFFYFGLLFLIIIGVSLFITTIYIHFKDIIHIWNFVIFIGFWVSPIIYPETIIPEQFLRFYMLNPLARIISHLRNTVIYNYIDSSVQIIITVIIIFLIFFTGLLTYKKYSKKIYDYI
ncbi:MAG: ABC transporter permease [Candidatus Heimdallarchaeaceae archaeon]